MVAASPAAPSNPVLRAVLPAVAALFRVPGVSGLAARAIARILLRAQPMSRDASWGHARVQWPDGEVREGWLRAGEATRFTAAVAAQVTRRLLQGQGRPGAHTPGALFGPQLARDAGATLVLEGAPTPEDRRA